MRFSTLTLLLAATTSALPLGKRQDLALFGQCITGPTPSGGCINPSVSAADPSSPFFDPSKTAASGGGGDLFSSLLGLSFLNSLMGGGGGGGMGAGGPPGGGGGMMKRAEQGLPIIGGLFSKLPLVSSLFGSIGGGGGGQGQGMGGGGLTGGLGI